MPQKWWKVETRTALSSNIASSAPFWLVLEADETKVGRDPTRSFGNILRRIKSVWN
jgi:hypothetical protein